MKHQNKTQKGHEKNTTLGPAKELHLMKPTELAHDLVKYTAAQKSLSTQRSY